MKMLLSASFAAVLLLAAPAWAQSSSEPTNQTPAQNQKMSRDYQQMMSNPGFRNSRMHKECDPIAAPDLKQQCMSSFGAGNSGAMGNMGAMGGKPAPLQQPKR